MKTHITRIILALLVCAQSTSLLGGLHPRSLEEKLMSAIEAGSEKKVLKLIQKGAQVNCWEWDMGCEYSPLLQAAACGHENIIRLLLQHGAQLELLGKGGRTAFLKTTQLFTTARAMQLLAAHGANIKHIDDNGNNALMLTISIGLTHNCSVHNCKHLFFQTPCDTLQTFQFLLTRGLSLYDHNNLGETALSKAASLMRQHVCEFLINHMFKTPSGAQTKRIINFLLSLRAIFGIRGYNQFKTLLKTPLLAMIEQENKENFNQSRAYQEVQNLPESEMKKKLLEKFGAQ